MRKQDKKMKPLQTRKSELFVTVEAERENLYTRNAGISAQIACLLAKTLVPRVHEV